MDENKISAYEFIDSHREEMLGLWEEIVNMESGTEDIQGVNALGERLKDILDSEGFSGRLIRFDNAGGTLVAELGMDRPKKGVIFAGHMDTVFPKGTARKRPFKIEDGKAYGPGALDMKGGIVAAIYAARALNSIGYSERPIKLIISGDEEVGHANSTGNDIFIQEAKGFAAAFDCETGFTDNGIIVGRKGAATFYLEVEGVSAHAGNAPEKGRSAILEMAHKIIDIQNLTDWEEGTTFNVGTITGGTVPNSIPNYAKIAVDVRYTSLDKRPKIIRRLKEIAGRTYVEGTKTKLTGEFSLGPMETTEGVMKLFEHVRKSSIELGLEEPYAKTSGGGSDAANTVIAGVPTVCAMGVKGEWNHTSREYAIVESLFERAKLLIACVLNMKEDII